MTKADIAREAQRLGLDAALSHSCYDPLPDGRHCGQCDACRLRAKGFAEAGLRGSDGTLRMTLRGQGSFLTLQGEGVQAGSRAVFLRFAGCNLWSGREQDRATAQCNFCDTDFVGTDGEGGGKFADADALAAHVAALWGAGGERRLVVITGGEPMLQLDPALVDALHGAASESRSRATARCRRSPGIDWLCVSPKAGTEVVQRVGRRVETGVAAGRDRPGRARGLGRSTISSSSRWTAPSARRRSMRRLRWRWSGRNGA